MAISNEMKQHLQGTSSVAVFLKITARDGNETIRVWNGTRNKIVDGETYYAFPVSPSQLQSTEGLKPDNLEITAIYSDVFNSKTLRARKWQSARVEYRIMNYRDFSMGHAERRIGFLGTTDIGKYSAKPEMVSLASKLNEPVGRTYQAECDCDELGDARCTVNLAGETEQGYRIKTLGTIAAVSNKQQFSVSFAQTIKPSEPGASVAADELYKRGKIRFITGKNQYFEGQIINNSGNALTLYLPLFYTPQVGDQIEITSGCDRTISVCRDKYANGENHRGFYCLAGRSKVLKFSD